MLTTVFYFVLALLILIVIHEFGHFIVARMCGVKVLRFSFGFGKVLAGWTDKSGTEYALSAVPLGGYIKMLDESEGNVSEDESHLAFNNKSVWARIAIVTAGPFFNFLFAFLALWLMWVIGIKSLAPMVNEVEPGSIAAKAGLMANQEILALDDEKIDSWRDFQYAFMPLLGSNDPITLTVKSLDDDSIHKVIIPLEKWRLDGKKPDLLQSFGIIPFVPVIPPVVGSVVDDTPAYNSDLQAGDIIIAVDDNKISDWLELTKYVRLRPNKKINIEILRADTKHNITIVTGHKEVNGEKEGFLGVKSQKVDWPKRWLRIQRKSLVAAIGKSFSQTTELTGATFVLIGRLIMGKLPVQSLSGPVGIAQGAGQSAQGGFSYYLSFLALVSISLGVLNLLPIPILDGGHLLYYVIEIIRRKPLSDEAKSTGMYIGLLLLLTLMAVALFNDISRLVS
jgi:regulator of sigma E protease